MESGVARVYCEALVRAVGPGDIATLERVLEDLLGVFEAVKGDPRARDFLSSPRISAAAREKVLERTFGPHVHDATRRFLMVLAHRGRLAELGDIALELADELDRLTRRQRVRVRTAMPLAEPAELQGLTKAIERATGLGVILETRDDPALIGGIVVQMGDTRIDGSIRRRLAALAEGLRGMRLKSADCIEA